MADDRSTWSPNGYRPRCRVYQKPQLFLMVTPSFKSVVKIASRKGVNGELMRVLAGQSFTGGFGEESRTCRTARAGRLIERGQQAFVHRDIDAD